MKSRQITPCNKCAHFVTNSVFCSHKKSIRSTIDYVTGKVTEYQNTCSAMRAYGPCGEKAKLFEAEIDNNK